MPIVFDCVCGAEIEALDGQAGRKVMCPACRSDLTVPPRSARRRPEPVPDLGIVVAAPARISGGRRRPAAAGVAPMNAVGLFSLLCALASYAPSSLAWWGTWRWLLEAPPSRAADASLGVAFISLVGLALAGLGLLACTLGRQRVVWLFSFWGVHLALVPFVVAMVAAFKGG